MKKKRQNIIYLFFKTLIFKRKEEKNFNKKKTQNNQNKKRGKLTKLKEA
jgi:hypothetical protein